VNKAIVKQITTKALMIPSTRHRLVPSRGGGGSGSGGGGEKAAPGNTYLSELQYRVHYLMECHSTPLHSHLHIPIQRLQNNYGLVDDDAEFNESKVRVTINP